jgi:hypothetical protein
MLKEDIISVASSKGMLAFEESWQWFFSALFTYSRTSFVQSKVVGNKTAIVPFCQAGL